jgi:hypothetical protein
MGGAIPPTFLNSEQGVTYFKECPESSFENHFTLLQLDFFAVGKPTHRFAFRQDDLEINDFMSRTLFPKQILGCLFTIR